MSNNVKDIEKNSKSPLKPVYYFYGAEDYLVEEAVLAIKSAAISGGFESLNYQVYDRDKMDASDAVAAAQTLPAFSERRVVVVRGAERFNDRQVEIFYEYVKRPSPSTCLIFVADTIKVERCSEFIKYLSEKGYIRAFGRLSGTEMLAWIKKEVKKDGKTITGSAANKLCETGGGSLRDVKAELEKIVLFAWDKPSIEDADVEDAGLDLREESVFALSDAIGSKDIKTALRICGKLSAEPPIKVLAAISRQIRVLLKLKILLRKGTARDTLPSMLGVPPFFLESYIKRSAHFTEEELKEAINKFYALDIGLKTGLVPEGVAIPKLIIELCGSREAHAAPLER